LLLQFQSVTVMPLHENVIRCKATSTNCVQPQHHGHGNAEKNWWVLSYSW